MTRSKLLSNNLILLIWLQLLAQSYSLNSKKDDLETDHRVIRGRNVPKNKYPFMIMANGCGASLISPTRILTAAHCKDIIGTQVYIDRIQWMGGRTLKVGRKWPWNGGNDSDILVAEISPPVKDVQPVLLDSGNMGYSNPGVMNTVIGWGDTNPGPQNVVAPILQEMSSPIITKQQCEKLCNNNWWPLETEMCTDQSNGQLIGAGDSGGPLFVKSGSRFIQTGIVHGAAECAKYGIFTRVSKFRNFIMQAAPDATFTDRVNQHSADTKTTSKIIEMIRNSFQKLIEKAKNIVYNLQNSKNTEGCKYSNKKMSSYKKDGDACNLDGFKSLVLAKGHCCKCKSCRVIVESDGVYMLKEGPGDYPVETSENTWSRI